MFGETVGTVLVSGTSTSGYLIQTVLNLVNGTTTNTISTNPSTRVMHITLTSGSGTNSLLQLANGKGGTIMQLVQGTSGSSRTIDVDYGVYGHTFPNGCYWTTDANLVEAAIVCKADEF